MSQQATMTMAGMGGPVGAMNVGTPNNAAGVTANADPAEYQKRLNTYIYDYFMRNHHFECARVMLNENLPLALQNKSSPNQRNGEDMDTDSKDTIIDRPKDLPLAELPAASGPFLEDWWSQFWDVWHSRRLGTGKPSTLAYITHQRQAQKARSGMMDPTMQRNFSMMNGSMPADLKKAAMQNSNASMQAQLARARAQQGQNMPQGNQMERQGSQMDARSGSPGSGGHPSPKRARVDGGPNNPQMAALQQQQHQRPGQIPNNQVGDPPPPLDPELAARTRDLILRHEMDPNAMPPHIFHSLALQPTNNQIKSLETYGASMQAQMKNALNQAQASNLNNKGMPPNSTSAAPGAIQAGAQGSPMPQQAIDGMMFDNPTGSTLMRGGPGMSQQQAAAAQAAMGGPGGNNVGGSHALQDYQMQLMLLEQQNKRRLMMARQEQDGISQHTGVPAVNGQFPPNMSPGQGGPSPNPNAMQGTPKMNNGPSPNGNLAGRGSPAPGGNFDPNMPAAMRAQMMVNQNGHVVPRSNPQMTQAQTQAEMFNRQQQAQMMNGNFPGQGMPPGMMPGQQSGPGAQPGQVAPNMTPRQGNSQMPPPPAPQHAAGNTQPNSPAPAAAPPTPNQTAKAKPGAKKDAKAGKAANKKGATAATPASESEQAPTPGSQAPVTPMQGKTANPANGQVNGQLGVTPGMQQPGQDLGFGMDGSDQFNMLGDFAMDTNNGDVLENFDFDAFLNNTGDDGGLAGFGDHFNFDNASGLESNETLQ